jgi:5-methylcytosine-specific restriction protein A
MGKLKALPSRLSTLQPRIGFAPGDEKAADKARTVMAPWRAWYQTERWRKLRMEVFVRDGFVCQRSGVLCIGKYPAPNSPVANHKVPHKGDPALFWDISNLETVAKEVHDGLIQSEERAQPRS